MSDPWFVLVIGPNGKRMLLNLETAAALGEDDKGNGVAVTVAGAPVPTGTPFDVFLKDLMREG